MARVTGRSVRDGTDDEEERRSVDAVGRAVSGAMREALAPGADDC
jgi:hypothetical protein